MNKKGQILGSAISTIAATIVIVVILVIFIIGAELVRSFNDVNTGLKILEEEAVGLGDVFSYFPEYISFTKLKFFVNEGRNVDQAIVEASYGKK